MMSQRFGPRPLGAYFSMLGGATTQTAWQQALQQLPPPFNGEIPEDLNMLQFMQGLQRYQSQTWEREAPNYQLYAQNGRVKLWLTGGEGPAVVLVPSMINKAYIFDLLSGTSLVEHLQQAGFAVYMIDWGDPLVEQDALTVSEAITQRLVPLLNQIAGAVHLVGYCMGGVMTLGAMPHLAADKVTKMVLAATPWDLQTSDTHKSMQLAGPMVEQTLAAAPYVSVEAIQTQLFMVDPFSAIRRIQGYADVQDKQDLHRLTALEDWLADGVALETPVARTVLQDWYQHNHLVHKQWRVGDKLLDPSQLDVPVMLLVPQRDKLVPAGGALALAAELKHVEIVMAATGHVGLMAGKKAAERCYQPIADWLAR